MSAWSPILIAFILAIPIRAIAQGTLGSGTFQDLDFESATIVPVSGQPFFIQAGPALPGWTAVLGSSVQSQIVYNARSSGAAEITLSGNPTGIDGNFSVILEGADGLSGPNASILQTGVIPAGANSIQFASPTTSPEGFSVSLNGLALNPQVLSVGPKFATWAAPISGFAGQNVTLEFTSHNGFVGGSAFFLDDISFSSQVIPEPGTWALFGLGSLMILTSLRRKQP